MSKKNVFYNEKFAITVFTDDPTTTEIILKYWDFDTKQNAFRYSISDINPQYNLDWSSDWDELDGLVNAYSETKLIEPIKCRSCLELADSVSKLHFSVGLGSPQSRDGMITCKRCCDINDYEFQREENKITAKTHHLWLGRESDTYGYVYILRAEQNCKIGKAKELSKRIGDIVPKFPTKVKFVHSFASNDYHKLESYLHKKFQKYRIHGEWFELPDKIIAVLVRLSTWNSIDGIIHDNSLLENVLKYPKAALVHGIRTPKDLAHD